MSPCPDNDDETTWNNCEGILKSLSGKEYVGVFKDGIFEGVNAQSGIEWVGGYKDGVMNGTGIMIAPNGKRYEGEIKFIWELNLEREILRVEREILRVERERREEAERIERDKQSASNPGFRDLKPGIHISTIEEKKLCRSFLGLQNAGTPCYGVDNLTFKGQFDNKGHLIRLTVDLGPIVQGGGFLDSLAMYMQKGETNIYLQMRETLEKKYNLDFEFSERDRQLFNEELKDELYVVYEKGQVALTINRKKKEYSHDLWLYLDYRDLEPAQAFFKSTEPKRAEESDF